MFFIRSLSSHVTKQQKEGGYVSAARDIVLGYSTEKPPCGTIPTVSEWINTSFPCSLEDLLERFLHLNRALLEMLLRCESLNIFSCSFLQFEINSLIKAAKGSREKSCLLGAVTVVVRLEGILSHRYVPAALFADMIKT